MRVLQLTVHLFPNIGGVETHLKDLFNSLIEKHWQVFTLAYQPLSTKIGWKVYEKDRNITILRIPWIRGFFEKLVENPILEFIYLVPGLFFVTPFVILFFRPSIIHAHGLSAAVPAVFWGKIFEIRTVISLHNIYTFPKSGIYHDFVFLLFKNSDFVLSLSKKSNDEVKELGIEKSGIFTYWIDLKRFINIPNAKEKLHWVNKFTVLFVGRLVLGKGINDLLESAKLWDRNINLVIVGSGPLEDQIINYVKGKSNIRFLGKTDYRELPLIYSAADCLIVPSTAEEGFGRVIIESLACETPVIGSKKGSIVEAMDETVGKFITVTPKNIKEAVEFFYQNPKNLLKLSKNARKFVERRYSEKNSENIINTYS